MSTIAINPIHRAVRFYEAPIGKKAVMAVTGSCCSATSSRTCSETCRSIPANPQQINIYAAFLHNPQMRWR